MTESVRQLEVTTSTVEKASWFLLFCHNKCFVCFSGARDADARTVFLRIKVKTATGRKNTSAIFLTAEKFMGRRHI